MADSVTATGGITGLDVTATDQLAGNSLNVTLAAVVGTTLDVTGNTGLSTVSTSGLATLNSAAVTNNATVGGTLGVTANTSLSTVSTSGLATLNSALVTNNLDVDGALDIAGNAVIHGNLTVNGTTTTVNSTVVEIVDPKITLNNNGNDASSEGAGIEVERTGTNGSIIYKDASASKFAAGPLGSEIDLVNLSGAQALTNKTIDGSLNTITNLPGGSISGTVPIANGGTGQTTAVAAFDALAPTTTKGDIIVNNGTDNVRLPVGTNGQVPIADSSQATGIRWGAGGAGSGGGSVNFITNGDAEDGSSIWVNYNDRIGNPTADRRPIDGSGGSPTVSNSITTGALRGTNSVLLSKPASDCQGQGWSTENITIPLEFRAKPLSHYLAYLVQSGTFVAGANGSSPVDGDLIAYFFDVTNGNVIESSNIKFLASSTTIVDSQTGTVQFDSNCTTVRMLLHIASQSTAAWNLTIDSAALSPELLNQGSLQTNFFSVTAPTIVGDTSGTYNPGTGSVYTCEVSLQGQEIIAKYFIDIGTGATEPVGPYSFNFPTGYTPDPSINNFECIGYGSVQTVGATPVARLTAQKFINKFLVMKTDGLLLTPGDGLMNNGSNNFSITIRYKVQGQSASVKMSEPGDGRVVSAVAHGSGGAVTANVTNIPTSTTTENTHGAWNGSTFTVPKADSYFIAGFIECPSTSSIFWYKNGVSQRPLTSIFGGGVGASFSYKMPDLKVGDVVSVRSNTTQTISSFQISIASQGGSQQIAGGENISARYDTSSGQSIPGGAVWTVVNFATKTRDTHGLVSTGSGWRFTGQGAAVFDVFARARFANNQTWTANQFCAIGIFKNGAFYSVLDEPLIQVTSTNTSCSMNPSGSDTIDLVAGDYFDIRVIHNEASPRTLLAFAGYSYVNIKRQGF